MENNNRTILAIALIILLWSGYSLFFSPQTPPVDNTNLVKNQEEQLVQTEKVSSPSVAMAQQLMVSPSSLPDDYKERLITVSSDLYDIKLSTTGATVRAITLKKYRETKAKDSEAYKLLELSDGRLATFKTSGSEGLSIPANLPFELNTATDSIIIEDGEKSVSFSAVTATGLRVEKTFIFHADSYLVDVTVNLVNASNNPNNGTFNLSLVNSWLSDNASGGMLSNDGFIGPFSFDGEKLLEDSPDDLLKAAKIYGDGIIWSGFADKYFLTILSPQGSAKQVQVQLGDGFIENRFVSPFFTLEPGQQKSFDYVSFIGPKDYDLLKSSGYQFEMAKDYGFFSVLAKPLMHVLKFFYGFIGNYGFAVILLTVCIKIIFWPLTQKSYKSMKGMQNLQPQMQKLREKYSNDKQRLNQEMMSFYKDNKVNPLGGCLPMLIQIPVFFALYQVLLGAIELRHAPFIFWITDLSVKDPYYITPVIMGATMFIQQKMTPTNVDPTQAKIMLMMPVVFTFMFLNFPAGLVVYWMVNNLLTILQQYLIKRQPN